MKLCLSMETLNHHEVPAPNLLTNHSASYQNVTQELWEPLHDQVLEKPKYRKKLFIGSSENFWNMNKGKLVLNSCGHQVQAVFLNGQEMKGKAPSKMGNPFWHLPLYFEFDPGRVNFDGYNEIIVELGS